MQIILKFVIFVASLCFAANTAEAVTISDIFDDASRNNNWHAMVIVANDGTFLGAIDPNEFNRNSIFNDVGPHGSNVARESIWNDVSPYGSDVGLQSPNNDVCINPPIVQYGNFSFYLTNNNTKTPGITVVQMVAMVRARVP